MRKRVHCGHVVGVVAFCLHFCFAGQLGAIDFQRGDANGDGVVSISDAHAILSWLFRGMPAPECLKAADADDSGNVQLGDARAILYYLFLGHMAPSSPFPDIGPDPTPDELACESYGTGTSLDDPGAKLEILDAIVAGGDDGVATITVALSNSNPVAGYSGSIRLPAGLAQGARESVEDLTGIYDTGFMSASLEDESVRFAYLATFIKKRSISKGRAETVLKIAICLEEGTPAGQYPLTLETGECIDYESSRAIQPLLVSGVLMVSTDVTSGVRCEDLPPVPPPPPPPPCRQNPPPPADPVDVVYKLTDAAASPGDSVSIPFTIRSNVAVQGYEFSLDFDEEILQAVDVEEIWDKPACADPGYEYTYYGINNSNDTPGNGGVDEGYIVGAVVFDMVYPVWLPVDADNIALRFHFRVEPATPATTTAIRFEDGGINEWGREVRNAITGSGETIPPELANSFVFVDSIFHVQPDITVFVRGDANGDDAVKMSDAITTLGVLFQGSGTLECSDAADANDDGELNISDPVYTLQYLFLGGAEPRAPFPEPGGDPTEDGLRCGSI